MKAENLLSVSYINYKSLSEAVERAKKAGHSEFLWHAPDDDKTVQLVTRFAEYLLQYLEGALGINK